MQSVIKPALTEQCEIVVSCVILITFNIICAYHMTQYNISAYHVEYITLMSIILTIPTLILLLYAMLNDTCNIFHKIVIFATLFTWGILLVIVADFASTPYFDECSVLAAEYESMSLPGCINYAGSNPGATGAQIIDALTEQNRKVSPVEKLLDRPLKP